MTGCYKFVFRTLAYILGDVASTNDLNLFAGVSGLIVPAATVGALGYGYMWWKVCIPPW
jgi:hypothetical protein